MNGSIRRRSKNSWELTIDLGHDTAGKRLRKFENVKGTRVSAERRMRELLGSLDKGIPVDTGKMTVIEFLERWMRDHITVNTRPRTAESYEIIIRNHLVPAIGAIQLTKLRSLDIQELEARLLESGKASRTVLHVHRVISAALKQGIRWGLLWQNPAEGVVPPRIEQGNITIAAPEEIWNILELSRHTPHHVAFHFM